MSQLPLLHLQTQAPQFLGGSRPSMIPLCHVTRAPSFTVQYCTVVVAARRTGGVEDTAVSGVPQSHKLECSSSHSTCAWPPVGSNISPSTDSQSVHSCGRLLSFSPGGSHLPSVAIAGSHQANMLHFFGCKVRGDRSFAREVAWEASCQMQ